MKKHTIKLGAKKYKTTYSQQRLSILSGIKAVQETVTTVRDGKVVKTETKTVEPEVLTNLCEESVKYLPGLPLNQIIELTITYEVPDAAPKKGVKGKKKSA